MSEKSYTQKAIDELRKLVDRGEDISILPKQKAKEIAKKLGISEATVYLAKKKILKEKIKEELKERGIKETKPMPLKVTPIPKQPSYQPVATTPTLDRNMIFESQKRIWEAVAYFYRAFGLKIARNKKLEKEAIEKLSNAWTDLMIQYNIEPPKSLIAINTGITTFIILGMPVLKKMAKKKKPKEKVKEIYGEETKT